MLYFLWFVLAFIVGVWADKKGRFGIGWFFLGLLLSPLFSFLLLLVLGDNSETIEITAIEDESKLCPFCAETIKQAAIICKHCGKDLPTS